MCRLMLQMPRLVYFLPSFHAATLTKFLISIDTAHVHATRILACTRVKHCSHSGSQVTYVIPPVSPLIQIPRCTSLGGLFKCFCTSASSSNHSVSVCVSKLCLTWLSTTSTRNSQTLYVISTRFSSIKTCDMHLQH